MNKRLVTIALSSIITLSAYADSVPDFSELFNKTKNSVVSVEVETQTPKETFYQQIPPGFPPELFERFFGRVPPNDNDDNENQSRPEMRQSIQGSGFIIDKDGYILTNAHVVNDADKVTIQLRDHKEYNAKVVGIDKRTDVALLKIDGKNLPIAKLGNSDQVKVGDWVLAIGSPFGLTYTATKGIVSALSRSLPNDAYVPFIQTDAAVNPGNSGGPLFNSKGEVIGINSQIYSRNGAFNGLAFAIPINVAKNVAAQLKSHGKVTRGWLGVGIQSVNQALAKSFKMDHPYGALITSVAADSPAKAAGLLPGDIIIRYNGKNVDESANLPPLVAMTPIGAKAKIAILRNGKEQHIDVNIENLSHLASDTQPVKAPFGLKLRNLTQTQRNNLSAESQKGVAIAHVAPHSPARLAGIHTNDILLAIGNQSVNNVKEAMTALNNAQKDGSVALLLQHGKQTFYIALDEQ